MNGIPALRPTRRALIALSTAIVAAATVAGTTLAGTPTHQRFPFNVTAPSPAYSAACGFPVILSAEGMVGVTVHTNPDGSVLEQDVSPGLTITVTAPSTGRSFEHVFGPTTYLYPNGVYVGASAVISSYGVRGDAPGIPPDAGRVVSAGVVVDIVPGIGPLTLPTGPPVAHTGHFEDPAAIVTAICSALSG